MLEMRLIPGKGSGGRNIRIRMMNLSPGWRPYLGLQNLRDEPRDCEFLPVGDPSEYPSYLEILSIKKTDGETSLNLRIVNDFGIEKDFTLERATCNGKPLPMTVDDLRGLFFGGTPRRKFGNAL